MEPIIRTKNLSKIYKTRLSRVNALRNVNVCVNPGEFVAIVGTSGSGKSTLLSLLAGLERPSAGKVFLKEKPIHQMSEKELTRFRLHNIGFIFQTFHLFPEMSALENAVLPLNCRGISLPKRQKEAKKLLEELGLSKHMTHKPHELSGGQQQRVAIARAVISKPKIIFADEPTGNLDSKSGQHIMELLCRVAKRDHSTLILVTHDLEKARLADRIICISDGLVAEKNTTPS